VSNGVIVATGLRDRAVDLAYAGGWALSSAVPEGMSRGTFDRIADLTWQRDGSGVRMLEANLARVVGPEVDADELASLSRAAMRSYMRYWSESFSLPRWSTSDVLARIEVRGTDVLDDAIARGRGLVIALPHSGNWDLVGAWFVMTRQGFATVAERLSPEGLFQRFRAYRESLGMEVLAADGGPRVLAALGRRLRSGGVVCLMADRDLTGTGVPVNFFGEAARFPAGPASLAVSTGAELVTVGLHYEVDRLVVEIAEPVERMDATGNRRSEVVADLTQAVALRFERSIADHPVDWHMLQPFWDVDRGLS
jgi:lauroyl/myristoyl acyltransferase